MFRYIFNLFITTYTILKFLIKQQWPTGKHSGILATIPSIAFAITSIPFTLCLLSVGRVYRQIVHIILTLTMREKYLGLITGCNAAPSLGEREEPAAITLVLTLKTNKPPLEIIGAIKRRLKTDGHAKLFALRKTRMGYMYLEKGDCNADEVVRLIGDGDLKGFLNKQCHVEMRSNFDVHVGREKLNNALPVVIRIHHCLADGLTLYKLVTQLFCEKNNVMDAYADNLSVSLQKRAENGDCFSWFRNAEISCLYPVAGAGDIFLDGASETVLTYLLESGEKYVPAVKRIKRRFHGVSFNAVVLSAFSASLTDFYIKKCRPDEIPENITTTLPVQLNYRRFRKAYDSTRHEIYGNDYSVVFPKLCIIPAEKRGIPTEEYIVDRLFIVQDELNRVHRSAEKIVNQTLMSTVLEVTPLDYVKEGYNYGSMTAAISAIPGGPRLRFFTGEEVEDVLFFTVKQASMGVCFTISTYANKLQLGLKANKSKFGTADELDAILRGVFDYLDVLLEKTVNY